MSFCAILLFCSKTLQYFHENLNRLLGDKLRIERLLVAYGPKQLVLITAIERRLPDEHLVKEDSKGPPVHAESVL